jgi:DNA-binding response OmpR family regulator
MRKDVTKKKILIVDDSHMIRRIVGMILKEESYEVLIAENGLMGYETAKAKQPDLVIMDVEMPVMNGIEATTRIKADAATAHIPVLIFTSLGSENDIRMAKEAGGSGFLNKPISKEELRSTISAILSPGGKSTI